MRSSQVLQYDPIVLRPDVVVLLRLYLAVQEPEYRLVLAGVSRQWCSWTVSRTSSWGLSSSSEERENPDSCPLSTGTRSQEGPRLPQLYRRGRCISNLQEFCPSLAREARDQILPRSQGSQPQSESRQTSCQTWKRVNLIAMTMSQFNSKWNLSIYIQNIRESEATLLYCTPSWSEGKAHPRCTFLQRKIGRTGQAGGGLDTPAVCWSQSLCNCRSKRTDPEKDRGVRWQGHWPQRKPPCLELCKSLSRLPGYLRSLCPCNRGIDTHLCRMYNIIVSYILSLPVNWDLPGQGHAVPIFLLVDSPHVESLEEKQFLVHWLTPLQCPAVHWPIPISDGLMVRVKGGALIYVQCTVYSYSIQYITFLMSYFRYLSGVSRGSRQLQQGGERNIKK